jgi:alpha-methylacyl-CoA racemase
MTNTRQNPTLKPLRGVRVLSLALNLPGPAALWRLQAMGARCTKVEPPAGDPMAWYSATAYQTMHTGVPTRRWDLKTPSAQAKLHKALAQTQVLLTSFRPSALAKLGLAPAALRRSHPHLAVVAIVGATGERAEEPGHDLTYLAEAGLVPHLDLPPSLLADMAGSLVASEAVLKAVLHQRNQPHQPGSWQTVSLADAAHWLAWPRQWGLTTPTGVVGGAHAGYRVYACRDGRVAAAALEPHFAARLCAAAGLPDHGATTLMQAGATEAVARFFEGQSRRQIDRLAQAQDIPLHTLPPA